MTKQDDALQAFGIFADLLAENQQAVTAVELEYCRLHRRAGRFSHERLAAASNAKKRRLGNLLLARYRNAENVKGAIDWDRFKQWCKDHWKAILAAKLILTVIFLFCV